MTGVQTCALPICFPVTIFDGASWVSVAGSSGAITYNAAENLAIEYILTLG